MEEKENFYHDLDKHKKRSFCTCQTLFFGLVILAIIVAGLVVWGVTKVKTAVLPNRQVISSDQDRQALLQKFSELDLSPGAATTLTITERELTGLLIQGLSQNSKIPFRNVQAAIQPEGIIVSGIATKWLANSLSITIVPRVIGTKLQLDIDKIQAGSLAVPDALTAALTTELNKLVTNEMNLDSVAIKSVKLIQGSMILTGTVTSPMPSSSP